MVFLNYSSTNSPFLYICLVVLQPQQRLCYSVIPLFGEALKVERVIMQYTTESPTMAVVCLSSPDQHQVSPKQRKCVWFLGYRAYSAGEISPESISQFSGSYRQDPQLC